MALAGAVACARAMAGNFNALRRGEPRHSPYANSVGDIGAGLTQISTHTADSMYDHNQTLVPDSFLALHSKHGRPLLSRAKMEARHELCEDMASHTAAFVAAHEQDLDNADTAMQNCHRGLLAEPSAFSRSEAAWVIRRVAELQGWLQPAWLDGDTPPAATKP